MLYHADDNALYIVETKYGSSREAKDELMQGKKRISDILKQAKFQQMNHFGDLMSETIDQDHKIANMPQIRVFKKQVKDRRNLLSVPIRVKDLGSVKQHVLQQDMAE